MRTWYEKFPDYYEKFKKISEEIEQGHYDPNLPGPFSMQYISLLSDLNCFVYSGSIKLKDLLHKFQYFAHLNTSATDYRKSHAIQCNILGTRITFFLTESQIPSKYKETDKETVRGRQILFDIEENGCKNMIAYSDIMPQLEAYPSKELGRAMLNALNATELGQNSQGLEEETVRAASLFILLTHICEAATPFRETMKEFDSAIIYNQSSLYKLDKIVTIKKKTGRIPMADKIVRSKLRDVAEGKVLFKDAFSEENFVIRCKGGTSKGRTWVLEDEIGVLTGDLSDSEDEGCALSGLKSIYPEYQNEVFFPES